MIGTNSAVNGFVTRVPLPSDEGDGSITDKFVPPEGESPEMSF